MTRKRGCRTDFWKKWGLGLGCGISALAVLLVVVPLRSTFAQQNQQQLPATLGQLGQALGQLGFGFPSGPGGSSQAPFQTSDGFQPIFPQQPFFPGQQRPSQFSITPSFSQGSGPCPGWQFSPPPSEGTVTVTIDPPTIASQRRPRPQTVATTASGATADSQANQFQQQQQLLRSLTGDKASKPAQGQGETAAKVNLFKPSQPEPDQPIVLQLSRIEAGYFQLLQSDELRPKRTLPGASATESGKDLVPVQEPVQMVEVVRQFGYSLFECPPTTFAPADEIPVSPDYVVGPGDDLMIQVWGVSDASFVQTVNRSGEIALPKVGKLRIWGLTFSQADRLIREQMARYFRGFQSSVTLGRLRSISVYVVGDAVRPGHYTVSGLSTLTNALTSASGPSKLGSLREIRLVRNGKVRGTVDLYDFLLKGDRTRDYRLESGDTIFIPPVGPVAGVAGEVKRPGIYELKGQATVADLIQMGGGATSSAYLRRVQLVRTVSGKERVIIDVDATSNTAVNVQDGDLIRISSVDSRIYNAVALEGAVRYPGRYELKPGMRLAQLLTREDVLPTAYVDRVEVQRYADDYRTEVTSVNLKQLWAGDVTLDLVLKPLDRIIVRSEVRPPASVTLTGEVKRPGTYPIAPGERLSSVLKRAGGFTDRAFVKGAVFTRESIKKIEEEQLRSFVEAQERRLVAEAGTVVVRGLDREEAASSQQLVKTKQELLAALARKVVLGRMVVKLDEPEKLDGTANDMLLEDGDALHAPQPPQSVVVLGSVRNPASVLYKEGEGAEYYLNRAGGFSKEADKKESYVVKADGSTVSGFTKIRTIEPGDAILVPPKEEVKFRPLGIAKDALSILSTGLLSVAALAVIF